MVLSRASDKPEAEARQSGALEDGEVRVVWQQFVNVVVKRVGGRPRQRVRDDARQPGVVPAGLEQVARAARAARVGVDYGGCASQQSGITYETFRPKQPDL